MKFTTCITRISNRILTDTKHTKLHPEAPWRITKINIPEKVQLLPTNTLGKSVKEDWANNHAEFIAETKDDPRYLLIYSDGSLTERQGRRLTGYRTVSYTLSESIPGWSLAIGEPGWTLGTGYLCRVRPLRRRLRSNPYKGSDLYTGQWMT